MAPTRSVAVSLVGQLAKFSPDGGARRPARGGRLEAAADFPYGADWNGVFYTTKRVRPIFIEEPDGIVVVTVYTYFF